MAITRGATISTRLVPWTTGGTDASITHTVDSGTTLLMVSVFMRSHVSVSVTPQWAGEDMTLVDATTSNNNSGDIAVETWAIVSPSAVSDTVSITLSAAESFGFGAVATNYLGTETSSVAAATNFLAEDVQNAEDNSTDFASAGTSGYTLYAAGGAKGGDADQITTPTNFAEIFDGESGTSPANDTAIYIIDYIGGAPAAVSWTWSTSDENAAHYLEIAPGSASVDTSILVPTGPWR